MKIEAIKYSDYKAGQRFGERKTMKDIGKTIKKAGAATAGAILLTKAPLAMAAMESPEGLAVPASGAVSGAVKEQIVHAFDPLVGLMMDLALPIASVLLTGAALMIMFPGMRDRGYTLMMNSCIGYCVVNLVPLFIKILAGIGSAL